MPTTNSVPRCAPATRGPPASAELPSRSPRRERLARCEREVGADTLASPLDRRRYMIGPLEFAPEDLCVSVAASACG